LGVALCTVTARSGGVGSGHRFVILPTDTAVRLDDLAVEIEARGFASLFAVGDHTHIPAGRTTPFPAGNGMFPGGVDLPDEFRRTFDFLIALTAAACRTSTIQLGTAIYLAAQRDPIATAKQVASLDTIAGGRFVFGVGYGWNVEEAAEHGVEWGTRRQRLREYVLAMKEIWEHDEATYHGEFVSFDRAWMWPKPVARSCPVLLGAGPSDRSFAAIIEFADGWLPVPDLGHTPADVQRLLALAEAHGRDPASIAIHVDGVLATDRSQLDRWRDVGSASALIPLPSTSLEEILPILDEAQPLIEEYRTTR
jgi:probable F420-dependent oxidoreductase